MLMLLIIGPHFEWQGSWTAFTLKVPIRGWGLQLDMPHQCGLSNAVQSQVAFPVGSQESLVNTNRDGYLVA